MSTRRLRKILVANRGEIACRIIRSVKSLGKLAVGISSDTDRGAPHTVLADSCALLGGTHPQESYLRIEAVIEAALQFDCDAVHPGYGFLSENPDFATACQEAGLVFIGPPPTAIQLMGSKSHAKALMEKVGVPLMPGYHGDDQSDEHLLSQAKRIGFPLLLKAASGGGGRGMRVVEDEGEFLESLATARRESASAFGDDRLLLEKYFPVARHIEVQILADRYGDTRALFERDCSLQRRHQKIIEEAPAPLLREETRAALYSAAQKAATAVAYVNAGTVEFLMDTQQNFYFMEMNTRLQVEHPVTEMITGVDLVASQIRIAEGASLDDLSLPTSPSGHAIEARIYAEDTNKGFLPVSGVIEVYQEPEDSHSIRVDSGVRCGSTISPYYDSMIAKVISHGASREEAIDRLRSALRSYHIAGLTTNREFLFNLLSSELISPEKLTTTAVEGYVRPTHPAPSLPAFAVASYLFMRLEQQSQESRVRPPWNTLIGFSTTSTLPRLFTLSIEDTRQRLSCIFTEDLNRVSSDDEVLEFKVVSFSESSISLSTSSRTERWNYYSAPEHSLYLFGPDGRALQVSVVKEKTGEALHSAGSGMHRAPMTGTVVKIFIKPGQQVSVGTPLVVVEAMKMEHTIASTVEGTVASVHGSEGTLVQEGSLLVEVTVSHDLQGVKE